MKVAGSGFCLSWFLIPEHTRRERQSRTWLGVWGKNRQKIYFFLTDTLHPIYIYINGLYESFRSYQPPRLSIPFPKRNKIHLKRKNHIPETCTLFHQQAKPWHTWNYMRHLELHDTPGTHDTTGIHDTHLELHDIPGITTEVTEHWQFHLPNISMSEEVLWTQHCLCPLLVTDDSGPGQHI